MTLDSLCSLRELYALEGLSAEEKRQFEEHLSTCKECQQEVEELKAIAEMLVYDVPLVTPPSGMRSRVLESVFAQEDETGPSNVVPFVADRTSATITPDADVPQALWRTDGSPRARRKRGGFWRVGGPIASAAVAVIATVAVLSIRQTPAPTGNIIASVPLATQTGWGSAAATMWLTQTGSSKQLYIKFNNLPQVTGKQAYQVWLVKGTSVYSLGVFTPDAQGSAVFAAVVPNSSYSVVAVTREPQTIDKVPLGPKVFVQSVNV